MKQNVQNILTFLIIFTTSCSKSDETETITIPAKEYRAEIQKYKDEIQNLKSEISKAVPVSVISGSFFCKDINSNEIYSNEPFYTLNTKFISFELKLRNLIESLNKRIYIRYVNQDGSVRTGKLSAKFENECGQTLECSYYENLESKDAEFTYSGGWGQEGYDYPSGNYTIEFWLENRELGAKKIYSKKITLNDKISE
ncbi:hypothetical protein EGI22_16020 [Lacihabitans sp. LS3-19]|uniref:hypothetical protein n=1 Tax=Lacihabitans sp. LS3-19 TaxID=2487335 RepID=UPI0020CB922F|nr:hypothetical protein [Lacihabitans sp. LS3-19]MCP9769410.1 hypothetical protein [Lacihabitans sp. LS3-19]